eukprot:365692-Chlamydomonas_euryale.AAC.2
MHMSFLLVHLNVGPGYHPWRGTILGGTPSVEEHHPWRAALKGRHAHVLPVGAPECRFAQHVG